MLSTWTSVSPDKVIIFGLLSKLCSNASEFWEISRGWCFSIWDSDGETSKGSEASWAVRNPERCIFHFLDSCVIPSLGETHGLSKNSTDLFGVGTVSMNNALWWCFITSLGVVTKGEAVSWHFADLGYLKIRSGSRASICVGCRNRSNSSVLEDNSWIGWSHKNWFRWDIVGSDATVLAVVRAATVLAWASCRLYEVLALYLLEVAILRLKVADCHWADSDKKWANSK